jgi:hypothetical protein
VHFFLSGICQTSLEILVYIIDRHKGLGLWCLMPHSTIF